MIREHGTWRLRFRPKKRGRRHEPDGPSCVCVASLYDEFFSVADPQVRRGSAGCVYEAAAPQSRGSKWISGERTVPQSDGCPDGSGKIPGRIMDAGHCALRGQSVRKLRKRRNFIRNLSGDRSGAWRAFSRLHSNRFHSAYPHSVSNGSKDMHGFLTFKRVLPILPQIAKNRA